MKQGDTLWEKLIGRINWLIWDQRGEVGEPEPEPNDPEPDPEPSDPDPEPEPGEPEPEPDPKPKDPEPEPDPVESIKEKMQERIDRRTTDFYNEKKRADLYAVKVGDMTPEQYKEQHDEYPKGYEPKTEPKDTPETVDEDAIWNMQIQGGEHDGKTLAQVHDEGGPSARYAMKLFNQELRSQQAAIEEAETKKSELLTESQKEIDEFSADLSQELFEKDIDDLTEEEQGKVAKTIKDVMAWMTDTNKGSVRVSDIRYAYILKNYDALMEQAKEKGVTTLLKSVKSSRPTKKSILSGGGGKATDGYEAFAAMDRNTLADKIGAMTTAQYEDFKAKAPDWFREQHEEFFL